ncbi:hypothetical protein D3C87_164120 [compost metagenome]
MLVPLFFWVFCESLPRILPDCMAQMYGVNHCEVGPIEISSFLVWGGTASLALFGVLTIVVALPLFILARIRSKREEA